MIRDKMEPLEKHVGTLHELVGSLEGERSSMTASQVAALDRVKLKSELLHVFTNNKKNMLEGDWRKNRSMLRAKAEGIAKRAQALRQSARGLKDS
ncbi:MAG: hypothetical protein IPM24_16040 [Bryobacterales bacterium]|nr:hypothetical protein [Bryobacterales bacterium]